MCEQEARVIRCTAQKGHSLHQGRVFCIQEAPHRSSVSITCSEFLPSHAEPPSEPPRCVSRRRPPAAPACPAPASADHRTAHSVTHRFLPSLALRDEELRAAQARAPGARHGLPGTPKQRSGGSRLPRARCAPSPSAPRQLAATPARAPAARLPSPAPLAPHPLVFYPSCAPTMALQARACGRWSAASRAVAAACGASCVVAPPAARRSPSPPLFRVMSRPQQLPPRPPAPTEPPSTT